MTRTVPNVFTVPPGRPFLRVLAEAILSGNLPRPGGAPPAAIDLPAITLYLPTQRSAKAMQEAFLDAAGGRALLLPVIRPIAIGDEEQGLIASLTAPDRISAHDIDLPPAISPLDRHLLLTRLVLGWSVATGRGASPAQASALARDLARLMDTIETEGKSLDSLATADLVPESMARHWQETVGFLSILTQSWPEILAERGQLSPAGRRNRLIEMEARRLQAAPPAGPVIVAGATGSVPATAALMRAVAGLPLGAVVLPGLDQQLDAEGWAAIAPGDAPKATAGSGPLAMPRGHPEHPQHALQALLRELGLERTDVRVLPGAEPDAAMRERARFIAEAMRPASTTDRWHLTANAPGAKATTARALEGVSLIEAATAHDEAEAIAYALRGALETKGKTVALVTPDRNLGRRVAIRLQGWGIRVDDSAGRPLAKTPHGAFLDHVVEAHASGFAPLPLMALLKHPLTRLGLPAPRLRRTARILELLALRRLYIGQGLEGLSLSLDRARAEKEEEKRRPKAVRRVREEDWAAVRDLIARLGTGYAGLDLLTRSAGPVELQQIAAAHMAAAEALAAPEDGKPPALWQGEDGAVAAKLFERLGTDSAGGLALAAADYPDLYRSLVTAESVRPSVALHPRLFIWGPFEARLMQPDLVVLGSLNDGIWPPAADPGPWLSRAMLARLGLPAPEARIGLAAHDFCQAMGAPEVVLTRAARLDGAPTVPSRWLLRIEALLGGAGIADALAPPTATPWLDWVALARDVGPPQPAKRPDPRPPVEARPRRMSVSDVETWIANPYAIYARRVLDLEPLPDLAAEPGADLHGTLIHQALHRFVRAHPTHMPDKAAEVLIATFDQLLEEHAAHPRIAAFWRPRFARFASWFAETEAGRREGVSGIATEVQGRLLIGEATTAFELTARADRIDVTGEGLVIVDYKSGAPPNDKRVQEGTAPQLPLEAAIATARGFAGIAEPRVAALRYIRTHGGMPAGEVHDVGTKQGAPAELGAKALAGLEKLIAHYGIARTAYTPLRRARFAHAYRFDDFAHLARFGEWSAAEGEDD